MKVPKALLEIYEHNLRYRFGIRSLVLETPEAPASKILDNDPAEAALVDGLEARISHGKALIREIFPDLSIILDRLNVRIVNSKDPYVDTMAVDPRGNIYINPGFSKKLTDKEFYGVLAHEALHHANGTFWREEGRDHTLWNIATDSLMNWALKREGIHLPKEGIVPDINTGEYVFKDLMAAKFKNDKIKVLDENGEPYAMEEIYDQLIKIAKEWEEKEKQQGQGQPGQGQPNQGQGQPGQGQPGQGQGQPGQGQGGKPGPFGNRKGDLKGQGQGQGQGPKGPKGQGQGQGQGGTPGPAGQPGQGQGQPGQGQPGQGPSGAGGNTPGGSWRDFFDKLDDKTDKHLTEQEAKQVNPDVEAVLTPEEMEALEKQRLDDLKAGKHIADTQASNSRGQGQGAGTGAVRKVINKSIPVVVDWEGYIKKYLKTANSLDRTWSRPTFRGLAGRYPSMGKMKSQNKLDAIFAIDTSGSIGSEELEAACQVVKDIAQTARNLNVRVVLWHDVAYYISDDITSEGALEDTLANRLPAESGGTLMASVVALLEDRGINPVVTIYLTDGAVEKDPRVGPWKNLIIIINRAASQPEFRETMADYFANTQAEVVVAPALF